MKEALPWGEGHVSHIVLGGNTARERGERGKEERKQEGEGGGCGKQDMMKEEERSTHHLEGHQRRVHNRHSTKEVVPLRIRSQRDPALRHRRAVEVIHARHVDGLLEFHRVLLADPRHLHMRVPLDTDVDRLVEEEPGVEHVNRVVVQDLGELGDVDGRQRRAGRLGERHAREGRLGLPVLEVHDPVEGVDDGADGRVGPDGGVDGHGEVVGLRLGQGDALDGELGAVDARLGDVWHADEESAEDMSVGEYDSVLSVLVSGYLQLLWSAFASPSPSPSNLPYLTLPLEEFLGNGDQNTYTKHTTSTTMQIKTSRCTHHHRTQCLLTLCLFGGLVSCSYSTTSPLSDILATGKR